MKSGEPALILLPIAVTVSCSSQVTSRAETCTNVPESIMAKMRGTIAYRNRDETGPVRTESYSAVRIGTRWIVRHNNPTVTTQNPALR